MERYRKLEIVIDNTLEDTDKALLFDQLALGTAEMVKRGDETIIWADTEDAEDLLIEAIVKKGKVKKVKRFPKRWAETTDLEIEGELSLDGTKKLVKIKENNAKDHNPIQRKRPEGYNVTVEFLEALDYTQLKNFIRRYPELDAELNLSSSKAVLLEATVAYFQLGYEVF